MSNGFCRLQANGVYLRPHVHRRRREEMHGFAQEEDASRAAAVGRNAMVLIFSETGRDVQPARRAGGICRCLSG